MGKADRRHSQKMRRKERREKYKERMRRRRSPARTKDSKSGEEGARKGD